MTYYIFQILLDNLTSVLDAIILELYIEEARTDTFPVYFQDVHVTDSKKQ